MLHYTLSAFSFVWKSTTGQTVVRLILICEQPTPNPLALGQNRTSSMSSSVVHASPSLISSRAKMRLQSHCFPCLQAQHTELHKIVISWHVSELTDPQEIFHHATWGLSLRKIQKVLQVSTDESYQAITCIEFWGHQQHNHFANSLSRICFTPAASLWYENDLIGARPCHLLVPDQQCLEGICSDHFTLVKYWQDFGISSTWEYFHRFWASFPLRSLGGSEQSADLIEVQDDHRIDLRGNRSLSNTF